MISLALILMTLPSRVAEVRARYGESSTGRGVRDGLPNSSREGSGGSSFRGGEHLDESSSAAGDNTSPARTGRYNKE